MQPFVQEIEALTASFPSSSKQGNFCGKQGIEITSTGKNTGVAAAARKAGAWWPATSQPAPIPTRRCPLSPDDEAELRRLASRRRARRRTARSPVGSATPCGASTIGAHAPGAEQHVIHANRHPLRRRAAQRHLPRLAPQHALRVPGTRAGLRVLAYEVVPGSGGSALRLDVRLLLAVCLGASSMPPKDGCPFLRLGPAPLRIVGAGVAEVFGHLRPGAIWRRVPTRQLLEGDLRGA